VSFTHTQLVGKTVAHRAYAFEPYQTESPKASPICFSRLFHMYEALK